jgi:DNA-binding transcriptional regulator YiaG
MKTQNPNIETRIANRAKSIFAAFGQTINDFYLEAGIYFVGGFNAALVAWDIYTTLISTGQPLAYAVALAIIAFIAVEGLAVYLVGAAAKTGNGWLWFFSVVFAGFFTYAHYREMSSQGGIIAQYITLAIPPFVVIGYWARVVKIAVENSQAQTAQHEEAEADRLRQVENEKQLRRNDEAARQRQIEDEERRYQRQIQDENRQFNRQLSMDKLAKNHQLELAEIEAKKAINNGQNGDILAQNGQKMVKANQTKKVKIDQRRKRILSIVTNEKLTQSELAERIGVSVGTIKNDLKAMNGTVKK